MEQNSAPKYLEGKASGKMKYFYDQKCLSCTVALFTRVQGWIPQIQILGSSQFEGLFNERLDGKESMFL